MFVLRQMRNRYKGKVNTMAYVGMLGDVAVILGFLAYFKVRQMRKIADMPAMKERLKKDTL